MMALQNLTSKCCPSQRLLNAALEGLQKANIASSQRHLATMMAWKIENSLNNQSAVDIRDKLKCHEVRIPTISSPTDLLVKVHSTSINPLDVRMCYGYGRRVLDLMDMVTNTQPRITNDRYPLTLGRDFSGEVVACGPYVKNVKPGDQVFGVVEPQRSGAHAQYVTVSSNCVTSKPENLTHEDAASVPFVALTAYSALSTFGGLSRDGCLGKSVLVLGGSGGVGSFAIQLLKLWGANVTATCSEEKIEWLENTLFVDQAFNYNDLTQLDTLKDRFDFVLDCGNYEQTFRVHQDIVASGIKFLKPLSGSVYVTLSPPILSNTDSHGIVLGSTQTALEAIVDTVTSLRSLNSARWAVFLPNKEALNYISGLYKEEALAAQVHSVFSFEQMPEAYATLQSGSVLGKVVVDITKTQPSDTSQSSGTGHHHGQN